MIRLSTDTFPRHQHQLRKERFTRAHPDTYIVSQPAPLAINHLLFGQWDINLHVPAPLHFFALFSGTCHAAGRSQQ